ncbi:hypothetical protein KTJ06_14465 [Acinetobacter baumannii]|nr:hypothetical protein [Acinetobacter baumannii]EJB8491566.1 hypothetical protein [Acinetobacter baumannii]EJB8499375.1 hypothetical protein [Acinetobacter baumannii]MCT9490827.1 hypothetical protein [Acinetobacter baumannii]HEE5573555.1 hypothetical protein [Acinetobacter baumannii]
MSRPKSKILIFSLDKSIKGCDEKIEKKGDNVGLSFYAFFKNKNDNPELLMEAAHWWIMEHKLDHFEKAVKIKELVLMES